MNHTFLLRTCRASLSFGMVLLGRLTALERWWGHRRSVFDTVMVVRYTIMVVRDTVMVVRDTVMIVRVTVMVGCSALPIRKH
jgi:hypothetical protein